MKHGPLGGHDPDGSGTGQDAAAFLAVLERNASDEALGRGIDLPE